MIGVAVVSLFAVFISSVQASIDESVSRSFAGDLVVSAPSFDGGLSPELATRIDSLPEVENAVGLGVGIARVDGQDRTVSVADPAALGQVLELDVAEGSLGGGLAVSTDVAQDNSWSVGDSVEVAFVDGASATLLISVTSTRAFSPAVTFSLAPFGRRTRCRTRTRACSSSSRPACPSPRAVGPSKTWRRVSVGTSRTDGRMWSRSLDGLTRFSAS